MTLVHCVPAGELSDRLLQKEHHELPIVFGMVRNQQALYRTPSMVGIPAEFCYGPGHMRFFFDKLAYLQRRYLELVVELELRGLLHLLWPDDPKTDWADGLAAYWKNDWAPTPVALYLNRLKIRGK